MTETQMQVIRWLAADIGGLSGRCMAFWLGFGVNAGMNHPWDCHDFFRCIGLLEAAPGLRAELPRMAEISSKWAGIVARWDELEHLVLAGRCMDATDMLRAIYRASRSQPIGGGA